MSVKTVICWSLVVLLPQIIVPKSTKMQYGVYDNLATRMETPVSLLCGLANDRNGRLMSLRIGALNPQFTIMCWRDGSPFFISFAIHFLSFRITKMCSSIINRCYTARGGRKRDSEKPVQVIRYAMDGKREGSLPYEFTRRGKWGGTYG